MALPVVLPLPLSKRRQSATCPITIHTHIHTHTYIQNSSVHSSSYASLSLFFKEMEETQDPDFEDSGGGGTEHRFFC